MNISVCEGENANTENYTKEDQQKREQNNRAIES